MITNAFGLSSRSRKKEIQSLSGPNDFTEFYTRLKNIVQYHKKNPNGEGGSVCKLNIYLLGSSGCLNFFLFQRKKAGVPISVELNNFMKIVQDNDDEPLSTNNNIIFDCIDLILFN
jgi:hypothetical protein